MRFGKALVPSISKGISWLNVRAESKSELKKGTGVSGVGVKSVYPWRRLSVRPYMCGGTSIWLMVS